VEFEEDWWGFESATNLVGLIHINNETKRKRIQACGMG
jgi:hypothetical protein